MRQWILALVLAVLGGGALLMAQPIGNYACQMCLQVAPAWMCTGYCM